MRNLSLGLSLFAVLAAPTALADNAKMSCNGPVTNKTVQGELHVPKGATCKVIGATVDGIEVSGGKLILKNSHVKGDVEVDSGIYVVAVNNTIEGDLEIEGSQGGAEIKKNRIHGSVSFEDNARGHMDFAMNSVGGSLECEGNRWHYNFYNNSVSGAQSGQCAGWR